MGAGCEVPCYSVPRSRIAVNLERCPSGPLLLPDASAQGSSNEPLSSLTKAQALQLRADISHSVLTPFGRPDRIPKEREPVQMSAIGIAMS